MQLDQTNVLPSQNTKRAGLYCYSLKIRLLVLIQYLFFVTRFILEFILLKYNICIRNQAADIRVNLLIFFNLTNGLYNETKQGLLTNRMNQLNSCIGSNLI